MSFFRELKRRNVFRVAITYLALGWLLTEIAGTLFPGFGIPDWAFRLVVIMLALGFLPVLVFSWAFEITPEGIKREKDVVRDAATEQRTTRRLDGLTISLILMALAFIMADRLWLGSPTAVPPPGADQASGTTAADPPDTGSATHSIAVLPFANRSDDPKDVFFVDGIHDDLLTYISQIGSLKTISRTSVMKYRDSTLSIPEIAGELGVATILEGGVQRAGDQVRINVQLIDAHTDNHLWSKIYDRQLNASNIFAIQSEIAGSIATALRAELTPAARERIERVPTDNLQALEAYFVGRQKMATRRVADLAAAIGHFEEATTMDPDFALAYVNLAFASGLYASYSGFRGAERQTWLDQAKAAVERALRLDPGLSEAHTAEGMVEWYNRNHEAAVAAFKRALQLNPNDPRANQWLGYVLGVDLGRVKEGLEYSRKAVTLDPKSAIILADLGDVLRRADRPDEALAQFQRSVAIEPRFTKGYRRIGEMQYADFGRPDLAIAAYREAQRIEPDYWVISREIGSMFLSLGDDRQAELRMQRALELAPQGVEQMGAYLAGLHLSRGETDRAMEFLEPILAANPRDGLALYRVVNHDLARDDAAGALARIELAFPGLLADPPEVGPSSHVAAIQLAAALTRLGEVEQAERVLVRAWELVATFQPRHHGDEAAIHAQRGDKKAALDALDSMPWSERIQSWRALVVGHPALQDLQATPRFQAINNEFETEKSRLLALVQESEMGDESADVPER